MTQPDLSAGGARVAEPVVRAATIADIQAAFQAAFADLVAAPVYGPFFGAIYWLGGLMLLILPGYFGYVWAVFPLAAGFALIGPFVAVGIYEVSRRRETGEPLTWPLVLQAVWRQGGRELSWMAFVTLFIFLIWMYQVRLLYALFFGFASLDPLVFVRELFTTADGLIFLAIGTCVGAVLALVTFSITIVSFPLLLDRDVDWITAMITSLRVVRESPQVLLGFGLVTAVVMFAAMLPAFAGLVIVLPLWGHATWHLYRRLVVHAPAS